MRAGLRDLAPLLGLGLASLLVYVRVYLEPYHLSDWWQHARLDYAWLTRYELSGQLAFVGGFVILFALYLAAVRIARAEPWRAPLWLVLLLQGCFGLALIDMYPAAALDLYDYLLYGRLGLYWGANPLVEPPARYPLEPMVAYSYWPNEPSVYGPLWQQLSVLLTWLVDGALPAGLYAFKWLALAAGLGTTLLLYLAVRRRSPELATAAAVAFGLNPLQVYESAGNGHNDAVMVLFLALALLLAAERRLVLVPFALMLGLLVKITLAPLAPLFGLAPVLRACDRNARLAGLSIGAGLAAIAAALAYAPFWEGRATLAFLDRGNWFTASPPTLLRELLRRWMEFEQAGRLAASISAGLFLLFALRRLLASWRQLRGVDGEIDLAAFARLGYQLFFGYLVIACLWWQPWYLVVLLALASAAASEKLVDRTALFCLGGLFSYPVFKYIWAIHQQDWRLDYTSIMALSVVVIFTAPLVHLLVTRRRPEPAQNEATLKPI
jgi:hypothetical protein